VRLFKWIKDGLSGNFVSGNEANGFVINPSHSFSLTIKGVDEKTAKEFKELVDIDVNGGRKIDELVNIIETFNVECLEVTDSISMPKGHGFGLTPYKGAKLAF